MKTFLTLVLLLGSYLQCGAQGLDPVQIAEKYYSKDTVGMINYLTGEALKSYTAVDDRTEEEKREIDSLRKAWGVKKFIDPIIKTEIIEQTEETAIVSVNISEDSIAVDHYLYFINLNGWKIEAYRSLALPGFYMEYKSIMKQLTTAGIDSLKKAGQWEGMEQMYNEVMLLTKQDSELIDHFNINKTRFESLLSVSLANILPDSIYNAQKGPLTDMNTLAEEIFISQIYRDQYAPIGEVTPGVIYFMIGGMLDNTAGYMYAGTGAVVPRMSSRGFIIIKEIGNGWYLFKTT